jgi:imidazolonepropionase-like amidohydrolase
MKNRLAWLGFAALIAASATHADSLAIVHAQAWTMTGESPLEDATIVATDGRIVSIAAGAAAPEGARIVDAGGKPVTPGLMNPATSLGLVEVSAASETVDHAAKGTGAPGLDFDIQYAINSNSLLIQLARADGLVRAITMPTGSTAPPFNGLGALLHLDERPSVLEKARVGLFATIGNRSASASVDSRAAQWQMLRLALETAQKNLAAEANATNRPPETLALRPVLAGRTPLAIATHRVSDIRQAIALARDFSLRVVVIGGAEAWMAAQELAAAKIPVVLDPMENLPSSFDQLGSRLDNAALLDTAGVKVAFSIGGVQSYNAGASLREGAGLAVANGLPWLKGLRAITTTPAEIWGVADRYGTIEAGREADLVVWNGDPLEPASWPVTVLIGGREISLVTRQTELRDRYLLSIRRKGPQGRR